MKRKKGFTLIELLVVMAIIAILASIVVPNVARYIVRARLTRAIAEINGMNLSLTAIITDAGRGNLGQLIDKDPTGKGRKDKVLAAVELPDESDPPAEYSRKFGEAADIYSRIAYDLLRLGRDCLRDDPTLPLDMRPIAQDFIARDLLAQLGTGYMEIGPDSWGGIYRVWPGPWRFSNSNIDPASRPVVNGREVMRWPIPFRIFSTITSTDTSATFAVQTDPFVMDTLENRDFLEIVAEDAVTWPSKINYPADGNKSLFIWSYGANNRSSQMLYLPEYTADVTSWFPLDATGEDIAGGDDVNNWDAGTSWQRFYM